MEAGGGKVRSDAWGSCRKAEGPSPWWAPVGGAEGRGWRPGTVRWASDYSIFFRIPEPLHLLP